MLLLEGSASVQADPSLQTYSVLLVLLLCPVLI